METKMGEANGAFPPEHLRERFDAIVARYPRRTAALIPILMAIQEEYRHIPREHIEGLAEYLGCTPAHVLGVITFYTMLSQRKRGRHHLYVCKTLSCHLRGAGEVLRALEEKLGIRADRGEVTPDGEFSLETAECLGLCEQAPCILADGIRFGDVTPETVGRIIDELKSRGA